MKHIVESLDRVNMVQELLEKNQIVELQRMGYEAQYPCSWNKES